MDITTLVLKLLAIYLVIGGLFLIFKGKTLPIILRDFFNHPAAVYLMGILLIFLSSMYLIQYNIWDGTWRVLVTIFAWLVMLKGLMYIFVPKMLSDMASKFRKSFGLYGFVSIVVGLYLFFLV